MPLIELDVPEGSTPAHVVSSPFGVHYFTEGKAFVTEEVADWFKKFGKVKVSKGDNLTLPNHPSGDPYDRAQAAATPPGTQEAALNPSGEDKSPEDMTEIEKAHEGLPNSASGVVQGTETGKTKADAKAKADKK